MSAPRLLSPVSRPQLRLPTAARRLQLHSERSEHSRMSERTTPEHHVDQYVYYGGDEGLGPVTDFQTSLAEASMQAGSNTDGIDRTNFRLDVTHPEDNSAYGYSTESDSFVAEDADDTRDLSWEDFDEGSLAELLDDELVEWEIDVYPGISEHPSGNLWPDEFEITQMGRIERLRSVRPWRNLREMYQIQTRALRAAINAEARQDLADFQQHYDCVVELYPEDARRSHEELSRQFRGVGVQDVRGDNWYEYIYSSERGSSLLGNRGSVLHNDMTWVFQRSPLSLTIRDSNEARSQSQMARTRRRSANSVLSLQAAPQSLIEWCPCKNLGPGPGLLKEAFCTAIRERRHHQRMLLEEVYIPQSRGCLMEDGWEASHYIQYVLAAIHEQFLERQWNIAAISDETSTARAVEALTQLNSDVCEDPIVGGQVESVLLRTRVTANYPSELWPCFSFRA